MGKQWKQCQTLFLGAPKSLQMVTAAKKLKDAYSLEWRRQWHPTPVLLPRKSHGQRSLVGCSPWGCKESDATERLPFHFLLSCTGEGNGNPLQYSCLEKFHGQKSLVGYGPWAHKRVRHNWVTKQISLPGEGGHSRPMPSKTVFPNPGGSAEELYSNGSKGRVADEDQDVCKVYIPLIRLRCLLK